MNGFENLIFTENSILIKETSGSSEAVMHSSESLIMEECANLTTKTGGHILEIGFGMGISANYIQNHLIESHTIIEIHPEIYKKAKDWSKNKKNVNIILGNWIDVLPTLNKKFNGIFHDTHRDRKIPLFLDLIKNKCEEECRIVFYHHPSDFNFFSAKLVRLPISDYKQIPYNRNSFFRNNLYEIKYTIYKDGKYIKEHKPSKII